MITLKSKESFDIVLKNVGTKMPYSIQTQGSRKTVIARGVEVAEYFNGYRIPELKKMSALSLISSVKRSALKYIASKDFHIPKIEQIYSSIYTDPKIWVNINDGGQFYIVDAKHCFWRIAYNMGVINEQTYRKHCDNPDSKVIRNIALAVLESDRKREYFIEKELIAEIHCDNTLLKQIYENIRFASYNMCGEIHELIPDYCFAYRTDAVFVLPEGVKAAKKVFRKNNMLIKLEKCTKVTADTYCNDNGELKTFK